MNNLKIIHWNSNGITKRINKLQAFASTLKVDTILLSETRLKPSTKLKISNYITYKTDLPTKRGSPAHGGTAILVHRRIVHTPISLQTKLQSTSIKIKTANAEITISSIYKLPQDPLEPFDLDTITNTTEWFIAA